MNLVATATGAAERLPMPDFLTRAAIGALVTRTDRKLARHGAADEAAFAVAMRAAPIAWHPEAANAQHYEVPAEFFGLVLGARRKYSCCLYAGPETSLDQAEEAALAETIAHADLADGQTILELGCGWGSLTLAMAERFPTARLVAVSNSLSQAAYIRAEAVRRGFAHLTVITADMNDFTTPQRFDRVVSVEMFEHMTNWPALLGRIRTWLQPGGRLFLHVFSHRVMPYRFDHADPADWIAQHFFTGGIMPSHGLIRHLDQDFALEAEWRWNGTHYARTAEDWLARFDANLPAIRPILRATYGADATLWQRRWRLFFLATAGLFGAAGGMPWGVSHYRLAPR